MLNDGRYLQSNAGQRGGGQDNLQRSPNASPYNHRQRNSYFGSETRANGGSLDASEPAQSAHIISGYGREPTLMGLVGVRSLKTHPNYEHSPTLVGEVAALGNPTAYINTSHSVQSLISDIISAFHVPRLLDNSRKRCKDTGTETMVSRREGERVGVHECNVDSARGKLRTAHCINPRLHSACAECTKDKETTPTPRRTP
ncbi:hypothetical protein CBL_05352 [Carabus blaptoides fortunei]